MTDKIIMREDAYGRIWKEYNGTCFHKGTADEVVRILADNVHSGRRLRFLYCFTKYNPPAKNSAYSVNEAWLEEYDTVGRIGRSSGSIKIPLLIKSSRSCGGGSILTDCVGKIIDVETGKVLYQVEGFRTPAFKVKKLAENRFALLYKTEAMTDFAEYALADSADRIKRLEAFLMGARHTKGGKA